MPFQSSIKNNNLFTSLEKNKQLYNQLLEIVGTANSIQGLKKDDEIYKKLHELYIKLKYRKIINECKLFSKNVKIRVFIYIG